MTNAALRGKPDAGNPHVRFDEGEVAPAATPRRGSLLYTKYFTSGAIIICGGVFIILCYSVAVKIFRIHEIFFGGNDKYADILYSLVVNLDEFGVKLTSDRYGLEKCISQLKAKPLSPEEQIIRGDTPDVLKYALTRVREEATIESRLQHWDCLYKLPVKFDYIGLMYIRTNENGVVSECDINYGWR